MITPEQAEVMLSADLRNIHRKLKAGKPLNSSERKILEGIKNTGKKNDPAIARRWGVSVPAVRKWRAKGYPVDDDVELAKRIKANPKSTPATRAIALEILGGKHIPSDEELPRIKTSPRREGETSLRDEDDKLEENIGRLQSMLDSFSERLEASKESDSVKLYSDLVIKTSGAITNARLARKRLGLEMGEVVSRVLAEKIAAAIASRMCLGVHRVIAAASTKLVGVNTASEVADIVERLSVTEMMVAPIKAATKIQSGVTLPDWLVDAFERAIKDYVEE